ncbi:MAG: UDP-3-O-(3-hydroxymyristoyl)glucosamine N-acyltransferase, partial [Planctomycetes bacterium]|nr:UDP-3-O-(3-hydroxymyristoyl)glucosamine N-acyltransferase [Planctomycetota bacterium]
DDVVFAFDAKAVPAFLTSKAGVGVVPENADVAAAVAGRDVVHHRNPQVAMIAVLHALHPDRRPESGIHATAVVDSSATLGARVHIGPAAVVDAGATIGDDVVVGAGSCVGAGSSIGAGTRLYPRVVVYAGVRIGKGCILHSGAVIGADGFGYARVREGYLKVPQVGGVEIGDDVEVGANACVDRGTLVPTRVGNNTKIDNLVQVGHNCEIGARVLLCGQVGLAGSTIIEDDCVLAGQVGVKDHVRVGRGSMAAAKSAILGDVAPGSKVGGIPQFDYDDWMKSAIAFRSLPAMRAELRALRKRLDGGATS